MDKDDRTTKSHILELRFGDVIRLKKIHPCGSNEWVIVRLGADIGIKCLKCRRSVMVERAILERRIKSFVSRPEPGSDILPEDQSG